MDSKTTCTDSSGEFVNFAIKLAVSHARKARIDEQVAVSVAGEMVVTITQRTQDDLERRRLFVTAVYRRLIPEVLNELRVFGPTLNTLQMRRRRNAQNKDNVARREVPEALEKIVRKSRYNHVEFMDLFSRDPELQEYVVLVAAGYTQTELINKFGYTRTKISKLKERFEDVYER